MPSGIHLERVRGHTICPAGLNSESVVVDAGAHRGEFGRSLMERFGCKCYLVEASPELAAQLAGRKFAAILPAALSARDGRATFIRRKNPEAGGIFSQAQDDGNTGCEVETISLGTLMRRFGLTRIDLLKLDIEGAEFELIEKTPDETLCLISQITVEFHDFVPEFKGRGLYEKAKHRLEVLGFASYCMTFRTHGDLLFLNSIVFPSNALRHLWFRNVARWVMKVKSW